MLDLSERTLYPSRLKTLALLGLAILFTAGGVWLVTKGDSIGWLVAGFFGLGILVFGVHLWPGSSYLRLSREGFVVCTLFQSQAYRWTDLDHFGVCRIGLNKTVGINFRAGVDGAKSLRKVAATLSGWEGALPDTYGMRVEELADLLNKYKAAADATANLEN